MARSIWGWGEEGQLGDFEALAKRAAPFFTDLQREQPSARLDVPAARVEVPSELAAFSSSAAEARAARCWGKGFPDRVYGFRGDYRAAPDFVCAPRDEA